MKCLYVLFDADCEICVRCRNWLAQHRFPGIDALKPGEQLLVISDEGAVYRGAHAWIMCLWALENHREHAQRLTHPALLPLAKAVCEFLSRNRFFLSDVVGAHQIFTRLSAGRTIAEPSGTLNAF
jgi:predicted DCC family thiol-disulfide oxidoreductase YuxK